MNRTRRFAGAWNAHGRTSRGRSGAKGVKAEDHRDLGDVHSIRRLTDENHSGACRARDGRVNWRSCVPKSVLAGAAVGVLTGLFGVGGGFIVVPVLTLLLGLGAQQAVATSLVVVLINSVAGLTAHLDAVDSIDHRVLLVFATSALVVSLVAARLATRLNASAVRRWFAFVVLAVAAFVAAAAIVNPSALG
ncbi:sulfite exporter TauE/SafE family protein [Saccharopolyspora sp. NPDC049426]|uniref:sulfite exporter TauE/SafE family protein n=1 Tax=Saccharopolyspora sp. NPDC049426 TaxID=3155652 RepID=UPI0034445468